MRPILKLVSYLLIGLMVLLGIVGAVFFTLRPRLPKPPTTFSTINDLDVYLQSVVDSNVLPGLTMAVVADGELVYNKAFGMADTPQQIAATPNTVWHWWSMTKPFTAVAILQLSESGQLSLDDPVSDYVPFFPHTNITIQQMLSHSSGMPDAIPDLFSWLHYEGDPAVNQTNFIAEKLPDYSELLFEPGTDTRYSNISYMVLGAVIESASGISYEDYIRQNVLQPLSMDHTDFVYTADMTDIATGAQPIVDMTTPLLPLLLDTNLLIRERDGMYLWLNKVYTDYTAPTGLIGTAGDHTRFMLALLNGGELDGNRILSESSVNQLWDENNFAIGKAVTFSLGIYVEENSLDGRQYFKHNGGGPGFGTSMAIYPDEKLGLVIMANSNVYDRELILERTAQIDWSK